MQGPTGGDEAVNDLFKSIYVNADEDSRRAMIKSMQESGGQYIRSSLYTYMSSFLLLRLFALEEDRPR